MELSRETEEWVRELKHASSTIGNDIGDDLEDASSEEDFLMSATERMVCLAGEVNGALSQIRELLQKCRKQNGNTSK